MAEIIKFPNNEGETHLDSEKALKMLDVIYNEGDIDDQIVHVLPNDTNLTEFQKYYIKLDLLKGNEENQELREYNKEIQKCLDDFVRYSSKLEGLMLETNYKTYRRRIENIIIRFVYDFNRLYNFEIKHDDEKIVIRGITINYIENDEFTLDYMYNLLVNLANLNEDYNDLKQ